MLEEIITPERMLAAMRECEKGVRWKASVQHYEINTLRWAGESRREVLNGTYRSRGFKHFDVVERGKTRHIQSVHIRDRAVQKVFCQHTLIPQIYPRLIYDNSASQAGKGTEFALKRLVEHLRWHYARYGKEGAVVLMDLHGYFDSIPHAGAIEVITEHEEDPRTRRYIEDFINSFRGDTGLGLGSELCQIAAVGYPNRIDKLVKEQLHVHCYGRYMDDSYLIHPERAYAERCMDEIRRAMATMGIALNEQKTTVRSLHDDFVYLKKRVHITDTGRIVLRITRENIRRERKRIARQREEYDAGRMPFSAIRDSYKSWRSYAQKYNGYGSVHGMDQYFSCVFADALRACRKEIMNSEQRDHL